LLGTTRKVKKVHLTLWRSCRSKEIRCSNVVSDFVAYAYDFRWVHKLHNIKLFYVKDAGSAAQFIKVELDWLTDAAKLAKQNGCKHFSLLTAQGANAGFWSCGLLYPKTKGLVRKGSISIGT
jgi:hypothetical protein